MEPGEGQNKTAQVTGKLRDGEAVGWWLSFLEWVFYVWLAGLAEPAVSQPGRPLTHLE